MKTYYHMKRFLKRGRLQYRRRKAARHWGWEELNNAPKVFGNAMPKAGSHLLIQILYGLTDCGPFINPGFPPVNRFEDNSHQTDEEIIRGLENMRSGEIRYGYLGYKAPYDRMLTRQDMATISIYRDPRDLLVSHVFYATDMHEGHGMHEYYKDELDTMEDRLNVAIEGSDLPGLGLPSVWERYENHLAWIENGEVLSVRFEDLVLNRDEALGSIVDYIDGFAGSISVSKSRAVSLLGRAIKPNKSGTFRKGKPGNWQEHFTDENKRRFKAVARDLLSRLGYENDDKSW